MYGFRVLDMFTCVWRIVWRMIEKKTYIYICIYKKKNGCSYKKNICGDGNLFLFLLINSGDL